MNYRILVSPRAEVQLDELHDYLSTEAGEKVASRYLKGVLEHIAKLSVFPRRGTPRDDIRPGLRTTPWRRRITIAFTVTDTAVIIMGISYGGRDIEALLAED